MRRDLCYYYPLPVEQVYEAFVQAANQKFGKNCRLDPCKTINFGLNFSFKYNMNGGSMTLHFMPYQNGTAIDLRYTIVQAMGARYKAHARDFIAYVNGILKSQGQLIQLDVKLFLDYEAGAAPAVPQETPQINVQQPVGQPVQQYAPPQQPVQQTPQFNAQQPVQHASQDAVPMHAVNIKPNQAQQAAPAYAYVPGPQPAPEMSAQPAEPSPEEMNAQAYADSGDEMQTVLIDETVPQPVYDSSAGYEQTPYSEEAPSPAEEQIAQFRPETVPVKRFCSYCGARLVENAVFCSRCGSKLR